MSDKPIIMSAPMVRALLDGRKTQTRRILKDAPIGEGGAGHGWKAYNEGDMLVVQWPGFDAGAMERTVEERVIRPPYATGDRLWVRESIWRCESGKEVFYRADGEDYSDNHTVRVRPSIHMPRWASRLTLIVTDVRVERLAEITDRDAIEEGVEYYDSSCSPTVSFAKLWDNLHTKREFSWQSNPWICVLQFRLAQNSDQ